MDEQQFMVVKNDEDQYSIWGEFWHVEHKNKDHTECQKRITSDEDHDLPIGWFYQGVKGAKQTCLDFIKETWTDMRPRSLQEHMEKNKPLLASPVG